MSAKHKGKGPQVLTANHLREGFVVWLTENMDWSQSYAEALKSEDEVVIEKMRLQGEKDDNANLVTCQAVSWPSSTSIRRGNN